MFPTLLHSIGTFSNQIFFSKKNRQITEKVGEESDRHCTEMESNEKGHKFEGKVERKIVKKIEAFVGTDPLLLISFGLILTKAFSGNELKEL